MGGFQKKRYHDVSRGGGLEGVGGVSKRNVTMTVLVEKSICDASLTETIFALIVDDTFVCVERLTLIPFIPCHVFKEAVEPL